MRAHDETRAGRPRELEDLQQRIATLDVPDVVDELGRLGYQRRAVEFRLLPKGRAVEVFEDLDPAIQAELVEALQIGRAHL